MASSFWTETYRKKSQHYFHYGGGNSSNKLMTSDQYKHEYVGAAEPVVNGFQSFYTPFMMNQSHNFGTKCSPLIPESVNQEQLKNTSKYELFSDDSQTSSGQVAFLNQLLEDTEDIYVSKNNGFYSTLSEKFCLEDETIGQLAIKLADLALAEANVPVKQHQAVQPKPNMTSGVHNIHHQTLSKAQNSSVLKPTIVKNNNPGKKTQGFHHSKKKRFPNKNVTMPKGFRQVPSGVNDARYGYPSLPHHKFRSYTSPHTFSGAPFWMDGTKSDGSSLSSNSSVHKESINYSSSDLMKYKMFSKRSDSEDDNLLPPQPQRRSRKAYSISSSSSGGRAKFNECVLCKTNGETPAMYRSHVLKDERGRTVCQVLQRYICPLCGATGTSAHTVKYCPKNENPPQVATMTTLKSMRSSTGRKRYGHCSGQIRSVPFDVRQNPLSA